LATTADSRDATFSWRQGVQLSIVVPVYNSTECLPELVRRIEQEVGRYFQTYELILVNDDSPDASWDTIVRLASEHDFITGVNLRKNAGQDNAIMAGLNRAIGETTVIMDDDLQHDPSDIVLLYRRIQSGFDVVYAHFEQKNQAVWKNFGSWVNDRFAMFMLGKPKNIYMSPYKAVTLEILEEIIKYSGPFPYIDGLIFTITSNVSQIPATHHARFAGKSNYNLVKSTAVWLKLATGFSVVPLRMVTLLGGIISLLALVLAAYFVLQTVVWGHGPEGWASVIVAVLFIGGIQLIGFGAIGEYIGRIFITQNARPQYAVKQIYSKRGAEHRSDGLRERMRSIGNRA
jgi:polyisoprenyl-phosphate glycosyltransferase